jgi:hypothetical protein
LCEETGESVTEKPDDFKDTEPDWECIESKSAPGEYYYWNRVTGKTVIDRPRGVEIKNAPKPIEWQRVESKSKPGVFYYFNPLNGNNEVFPPTVRAPWKLKESASKKGQFYYYNEESLKSTEVPPDTARPATDWPSWSSHFIDADRARRGLPPLSSSNGGTKKANADGLPSGWRKEASSKYPGKFYYVQEGTGKVQWERPVAAAVWEKKPSSSHPGKFYYQNTVTGETKWTNP